MKGSIFKSFRFEIILYSLLSLIYALLTEAVLSFGIFIIYRILNGNHGGDLLNRSLPEVGNSLEQNNVYNNYDPGKIPQGHLSENLSLPDKGFVVVFVTVMVIIGITLFIMYFLLLTKKFAKYIDRISTGITAIAAGDFETKIVINNDDEFSIIAEKINQMAKEIKKFIENDRKGEYTKNQLITSVAHDLRTPLTSIIGYLDLVSAGSKVPQETKEQYIKVAYNKSKRLEKLIEDLFAYTKFSSGEVVMDCIEIDIIKFMTQLVDEFYPSFQESGLEYEFVCDVDSSIVVADGNLLARAFANLIENAIKYGKDGKSVRIELKENKESIRVLIINYGKLIPENELDNIFDRFYRLESSRSSETGGTGLGLAIAKNIVLMHEGTIEVRSDFNGTVFEVDLKKK
ncbi:MAG: integral rane sensor signal transduction histidine kinase [Anaerocolumna sp.]|nr:integral rane sensor signal transduction histidine kinase [Anaerocolumna sp.]